MTNAEMIWRPYTQHQTMPEMVKIESGQGAHLLTEDGQKIVDLISSWWVNIHGHSHPAIAAAIAKQAAKLDHVIFAGFTHEPAEKFAESLLGVMGKPYQHLFYSDNGSTSVEVALKMALQFAINRGETKRTKIIAFQGGFHGDTWAAMAAGRTSGFFDSYKKYLNLDVEHVIYPATHDADPRREENEETAIDELSQILARQGQRVAAIMVEPLVQGASGMRVCSPEWLDKMTKLAQSYGITVIFDEVMTGFGRTGTMFAYQQIQTRPDIVCLSKGITGGCLPLSVTVTTSEVFNSFLGDSFAEALSHGHSYAGNPIVCAAALASLQLFESERTLERIATQSELHRKRLRDLPRTTNHRVLGAIAACELELDMGYGTPQSVALRSTFIESGLLIRPLGNTLYLMPPACLSTVELDEAYSEISRILSSF